MNEKSDFTFLTKEQVFGENQLDILKKYGARSSATDFAILLGACIINGASTCKNERFGFWWTKTAFEKNSTDKATAYGVDNEECIIESYCNERYGGARPAIPYSEIEPFCKDEVINDKGIKEVLCGEYPQTIIDENFSRELETFYTYGSLSKTDKKYTTDLITKNDTKTSFRKRTFTEYEYKGNKYVRFVADLNCDGETLSDGRKIKAGKVYWIRVEPITWLVDEKADIALSKNILFSGVQFDNRKEYKGDFENTNIKQFMDEHFSKEIEIENKKELSNNETNNTQSISEKTKKPDRFSNKENSEQDNLKEIERLKKKIRQLEEELKPLQELKKVIVNQLCNQKVCTHCEKKKSK